MEDSERSLQPHPHSVNNHTTTELQPSNPSLLGLPVEVRLAILKYLLIAPEPLTWGPPSLNEGVQLLVDWNPDEECGDSDEDSDEMSDEDIEDGTDDDRYVGIDGYADCINRGQEKATQGGFYELSRKSAPRQTQICRWLIGNEVCQKQNEHNEQNEQNCCHPAILQTCRRINSEGQDLLYSNTIALTYFCDDFSDKSTNQAYVLGQDSIRSLFEVYPLCQNFRRWSIKIWCDSEEDTDNADLEPWAITVSRDVEALRKLGTLDSLNIGVHLLSPSSGECDQDPEDRSFVFYNPLRSLRSKLCVIDLDRGGHQTHEYYEKREQEIQEEITSNLTPRDPYILMNRVTETANEILVSSNGFYWDEGVLVHSIGSWECRWRLPPFGNVHVLCNTLEEMMYETWMADHDACFDSAHNAISQITDYIRRALQDLDRLVTESLAPESGSTAASRRTLSAPSLSQTGTTRQAIRERTLVSQQKAFLREIEEEMRSLASEYRLEPQVEVEE